MVFYSRDSCSDFEKKLTERGYKKWIPNSRIDTFDYSYQKRFDDDFGKKYFIDFQFYDYMKYYHDHGISVKASVTFNNDNEENIPFTVYCPTRQRSHCPNHRLLHLRQEVQLLRSQRPRP